MYLQTLSNKVPPVSYTQNKLWQLYKDSDARKQLKARSVWIIDKVLNGDNGIEKRHFALDTVASLPQLDAQTLNNAFEREAPKLGSVALEEALDKAALRGKDLDALIVCTCTGYLCPGVASHLAEQLGMRDDVFLLDIVGQGCGAAIPSIRSASHILAANPNAHVAVVAVEICSAAFYLDDDPGVLISACLFGDGASASIWSGNAETGLGLRAHDFDTLHLPKDREMLRFENRDGKLRNRLDRCVPQKAAQAVKVLHDRSLNRSERPVQQIVSHAGGRDVLEAVERLISGAALQPSREVLRQYGNMSSPSMMFALESYLNQDAVGTGQDLWLTSFGAGFAAHSFRLGVD